MPALHLAFFSIDVSPPVGHPLCGGWIEPCRAVDDKLKATGVVLLGPSSPVILGAVDWCGLRNDAHRDWCAALAEAAHTTPERVAVQCVHPHNAPFADTGAEKHLAAAKAGSCVDRRFFKECVGRVAEGVKASLAKTERFTHVGVGRAKVEKVASARRVVEGGKVKFTRTSATRDPKARDAPEGRIDPWLRTLSFWKEDAPLAALHYYSTHPMSYYGDGRVTPDFCGLARDAFADEAGGARCAYFTGAAGDVTAGKYNDGDKKNRAVLKGRMLEAMRAAWKATKRHAVDGWTWRETGLKLEPRREKGFSAEASRKVLEDGKASKAARGNAAFQLAWLERLERPVPLSCLEIGPASVLHLPGEPFVHYQLLAQEMRKDRFVCVAGYGDGGMGYLPTDAAFLEGGYEPTVALAAPCQKRLEEAMRDLLK
ncbi:MAG: hypothetical protein K2W96_00610 [Gemmataceae bacterium]|nr:hypothetical protein [Gemmataceae bacterium]